MKIFLLGLLIFLTDVEQSVSRVAPSLDDDGPFPLMAELSHLLNTPNLQSFSNISPNNRTFCPETDPVPPNRVNTTERRDAMRQAMEAVGVDAYIFYNADQHLVSKPHYQRVLYLSGLAGTGYGAITPDKAAIWVDGRYFLQSDNQMDCGWIQMKLDEPGYPSLGEWLAGEIGAAGVIAADPRYVSTASWETIQESLATVGGSLSAVDDDLLFGEIWTTDRPELLNNPLIIHTLAFTGRTWADKLSSVRARLVEEDADVLVLASLDDIAWLFNLRGTDQPTSPLFDSFALIKSDSARLYLRNFATLIAATDVQTHLDVNADGTCKTPGLNCIEIGEYGDMLGDLQREVVDTAIHKIWISDEYSYSIYNATQDKREVAPSPIQIMKSVKNPTEIEHYRQCQIRDSAAVVEFAAHITNSLANGESWDELTASDKVTEIRSADDNFIMVSFDPIAAAGPNAAVIHYRPDEDTNSPITTDNVFLLDSGGNYLDGTTDVTRTFHFGEPTDVVKDAYTRVLIGHIELDSMIWPSGLYGSDIDAVSRAALWANGWDFQHGTGHGIGYGLNVHEGPPRLITGFSSIWEPLQAGMFLSDEPGYYEAGEYGIRLENIFEVVEADTPNNFAGVTYLGFRASTLVPYEPRLIKYEMLNAKQRRWLNTYNTRVREETGKYLEENGKQQAIDWMMEKTEQIPDEPTWTSSAAIHKGSLLSAALSVVIIHALIRLFHV